MKINLSFLVYTISIGFFSALHFTCLKMLKGNPNTSLFFSYIIAILLILIINYFIGDEIFPKNFKSNSLWILGEGLLIVIFPFLIVKGFQLGYNPAIFTLSNTIIATIFLIFINYIFFKISLNIYNYFGLIFGILAIYLLTIKQ